MNISTEVISRGEALASLAPDWWDLWRRSPAATPFQSPAWLVSWWDRFSPGTLCTIAAWSDGRLIGLAPLYLEQTAAGRRVLPIGTPLSDYLDVLVDPTCAELAGAAMAERLAAAAGDWDRCDLEELAPGAAALALAPPPGCTEDSTPQSACPVLSLPEHADQLRSRLPPTIARKLRQARNRAARRGKVHIERSPAGGLAQLFRLHGARWRSRGADGVLNSGTIRLFHRQAAPGLLAAGILRLYTLRIGDTVAGAYYGFIHRRRAYAYLGGLDPEFSFESPGTILIGHAMEEAVREGANEFHFLRGRESYKYSWGAKDRWNRRRSFRRDRPSRAS